LYRIHCLKIDDYNYSQLSFKEKNVLTSIVHQTTIQFNLVESERMEKRGCMRRHRKFRLEGEIEPSEGFIKIHRLGSILPTLDAQLLHAQTNRVVCDAFCF